MGNLSLGNGWEERGIKVREGSHTIHETRLRTINKYKLNSKHNNQMIRQRGMKEDAET